MRHSGDLRFYGLLVVGGDEGEAHGNLEDEGIDPRHVECVIVASVTKPPDVYQGS